MKRIGFVTQKGGAGKSTGCLALAGALAQKHRVALVDLDRQRSLTRWAEISELPDSMEFFTADKPADLKQLSGFDFAVIDTAGVLAADVLPFLDLVLLPVAPSAFDVWAAAESVELVKAHQAHRSALVAALYVNRMQPKTILGREVSEAIAKYELPLLDVPMSYRTAYPVCIAKGKTPVTSGNSDIRYESLRFSESVKKLLEGQV